VKRLATEEQLHKQRKRLDVIEIKRNVHFLKGIVDVTLEDLHLDTQNQAKKHYESAIKLLDEIEKEFVNE